MGNNTIRPTCLGDQPDENEFLWKYMTIQKFLSFLLDKHFYYSRLDQLEDINEGINQKHLSDLLFHQNNKESGYINTEHPYYNNWFSDKSQIQAKLKFEEKQKREYVLCWITGPRESAGMWNLYSEPGGVAIKILCKDFVSNLPSDKCSFDCVKSIRKVEYGLVTYMNFADRFEVSSASFKTKNPAFRKDISFEHEREFRVCVRCEKLNKDVTGISQTLTAFDDLAITIVMHPKSKQWQIENVRKLLEALAPSIKMKNSELKLR